MAGPGIPSSLPSIGNEQNPVGDLLNITPTIAEILGFKEQLPGLTATNQSLFDLI